LHSSCVHAMLTALPIFSLLSLKRKVRLMRSPVCLFVCLSACLCVSPLITIEPIGRLLWNSVGKSCHWRWPWSRTFLIPYLQPFQNGGRSNYWGGCKTCNSQRGTMKLCILIDLQRMNNF
jgi:hypothetical protein